MLYVIHVFYKSISFHVLVVLHYPISQRNTPKEDEEAVHIQVLNIKLVKSFSSFLEGL